MERDQLCATDKAISHSVILLAKIIKNYSVSITNLPEGSVYW